MKKFTVKHFSLALPAGKGQANIAGLLRHLAQHLDENSIREIQDIVFHDDVDEDGNSYPSFTVYYY